MKAAAALRATLAGIRRSLSTHWQPALGAYPRLRTDDRFLLELTILPSFARRGEIRRTLFCGCAAYTQHYEDLFAGGEYWTIDPVVRRQRYGSAHHIVGKLEQLSQHDTDGPFDLIVCNGVLGWGINTPKEADEALSACHRALRPGGYLLLGWNDVFPRNRVKPEQIPALARFEHTPFEAFGARVRVRGSGRHVFDFYRKPADDPDH